MTDRCKTREKTCRILVLQYKIQNQEIIHSATKEAFLHRVHGHCKRFNWHKKLIKLFHNINHNRKVQGAKDF